MNTCRQLRLICLGLLLCLLGFAVAWPAPGWSQGVKTVALMVVKPENTGGPPQAPAQGLTLGIGTLLRETLARTPGIAQLDWTDTSGIAQLVQSGLYRLPPGDGYHQWRALVSADVFVECTVTEDKLVYTAHSAAGSVTRTLPTPLTQPKQAAAAVIHLVFERAGVTPSPEVLAQVDDPETNVPALMLEWMCWLDYVPSPYNHTPWRAPNLTAGRIVEQDPASDAAWPGRCRCACVPSPTAPIPRVINPRTYWISISTCCARWIHASPNRCFPCCISAWAKDRHC